MWLCENELEALIMCIGRVVGAGQRRAFCVNLEDLQRRLREEQRRQKREDDSGGEGSADGR